MFVDRSMLLSFLSLLKPTENHCTLWGGHENRTSYIYDCLTACDSCSVGLVFKDVAVFWDLSSDCGEYIVIITDSFSFQYDTTSPVTRSFSIRLSTSFCLCATGLCSDLAQDQWKTVNCTQWSASLYHPLLYFIYKKLQPNRLHVCVCVCVCVHLR